jgi:hypothetical protein
MDLLFFKKRMVWHFWWHLTEEISPTEYVALKGDQTIATDEWIYTGIFNESCEVYELINTCA